MNTKENATKNSPIRISHLLQLAVILIATALIVTLKQPPLTILPATNDTSLGDLYYIGTYSDRSEGGNSVISNPIITDSVIATVFTLNSGVDHPYAGIYMAPHYRDGDPSTLNFEKYTHIHIELYSKSANSFFIYLKSLVEDTLSGHNKHAPFRKEFPIKNGLSDTLIALSDFNLPTWWKDENIPSMDRVPFNLSKITQIDFANGNNLRNPEGSPIDIKVTKITLHRKTTKESAIISLIAIISIFAISIISKERKTSKKVIINNTSESDPNSEKIIISYDKVEMRDDQEDDLKRITEQIAKSYHNPNFSVEQLAKEAGVSTSKIPTLLKQKYNMNFKQYLNIVRITEAKRLLLETDHQIVAIAHSVGYNNIPHFNRTFKQNAGISPKRYRQEPHLAENNLPGKEESQE